jgi:hypothetical protein
VSEVSVNDDYGLFRQTSYMAMVTALGIDWKMLPSTERTALEKVIDDDIVKQVRLAIPIAPFPDEDADYLFPFSSLAGRRSG